MDRKRINVGQTHRILQHTCTRLSSNLLVKWAATLQLTISIEKCCVLNIGSTQNYAYLHISNDVLPVVYIDQVRDLGVIVSHDLRPATQINATIAKAHQRANAIHRAFVSRDISPLVRAFLVYVRPIVEYNSIIWSPHLKQDIESVENVQRRFTKRLPGFKKFSYQEKLRRLDLPSLELCRLHCDLLWCYKIIFGYVDINFDDMFEFRISTNTRGHKYKLFKKRNTSSLRLSFYIERVVNVWNHLLQIWLNLLRYLHSKEL